MSIVLTVHSNSRLIHYSIACDTEQYHYTVSILRCANLAGSSYLRHKDGDASEEDSLLCRFEKIVGGLGEEVLE